jgi:hypothetical protein
MAPCDQAALGLLEYRNVPGKMREATAGVTEPLRRLLSVTIQPASTATKPSAMSAPSHADTNGL